MKNLSHIKKIDEFLNAENSFSRNKLSIYGTQHNKFLAVSINFIKLSYFKTNTRLSLFLSVGVGAGMPSPFGGGASGGMAMSPFGLAAGGDRTPGKILDPMRFRNT